VCTGELTTTILTANEARDLVEQVLNSSGSRVYLSSQFVDETLPGGSQYHVEIPDITRGDDGVRGIRREGS